MTLERKIASKARDLVEGEKESDPKHEKESAYRALCEGLPILLRTAGLAQTAAFLKAKDERHKQVYKHLETQLTDLGFLAADENLLAKSTDQKLTTPQYRMLSEIAMLVVYWQKRMAQALLRKKDDK